MNMSKNSMSIQSFENHDSESENETIDQTLIKPKEFALSDLERGSQDSVQDPCHDSAQDPSLENSRIFRRANSFPKTSRKDLPRTLLLTSIAPFSD
mmetsp:Transcript_15937/g.15666  ORF Transcript_15937/g.15666 Transcript_15937/m.15666 type:complete len:96 (+) Transcript_15937:216-503(+)